MTVVRCRTILDWVLWRHTIIDEVVCHRTSIAQISCDEPRRRTMSYVTSYDIARSSLDIPHERESQQVFEHDQKLPRHREIGPDDCHVVQRLATSHDLPRWSAITLKSPIVGDRKTSWWPVWQPAIKSKV